MLIAVNPDEDSRLPLLLRVPLAGGDLLFRTSGTWPRDKALFCYPVGLDEWPADPVIVERVPLRSCRRRGAAIDVIADRSRQNRSQLVFTPARGRDVVFWQSPRTRKQARPNVRTPTARAARHQRPADRRRQPRAVCLPVRYPAGQHRQTRAAVRRLRGRRRRPAGRRGGAQVAGRSGRQPDRRQAGLAVGELAALPRAAVVVEDRYSQLFKLDRVHPAMVADGLAELQVRWPNVPVVFCETRQLAEEWTYRFLAAAHAWAVTEEAALQRISPITVDIMTELDQAPAAPTPSTARSPRLGPRAGLQVPDRGRLRPEIWQAWHNANAPNPT